MTTQQGRKAPFNLNQIVKAVTWFLATTLFIVWFAERLLR